MKFVFTDGEKIGIYTDGKTEKVDSRYITNYREKALQTEKNREWKKNSDRMLYEEDFMFNDVSNGQVNAVLHDVAFTNEENKLIYAFSVNETSGIYYKYLDDETKIEAHVISSNEVKFLSLTTGENKMLAALQTDEVRSNIAVFEKKDGEYTGDYTCITGGDSFDENPVFYGSDKILFNSYGIARDAMNEFLEYTPSEIYSMDLSTLEIETLLFSDRYSYIKPIIDDKGNLYCIRKPAREKSGGNLFLDILLIPVRIIQGIIGFISAFVMCFAGKPMVGGREYGNNSMARRKNENSAKLFVNNNLINVEKELKNNRKMQDGGFIPKSWVLVKLEKAENGKYQDGKEYDLAYGVADFCLLKEKTDNGGTKLLYTNGRHVFEIKDYGTSGEKNKLFDTDSCLHISCI